MRSIRVNGDPTPTTRFNGCLHYLGRAGLRGMPDADVCGSNNKRREGTHQYQRLRVGISLRRKLLLSRVEEKMRT